MPSEPDTRSESANTRTVGLPGQRGGSAHPVFHHDALVSDRFKIVRLLGQGGMGAVYEAEDLELGGHVALKTVRPETATNPRSIERFKQEIYLARKVTHPNVCRIFDLFHHRVGLADGEIMFVTMELLRGETLADRLRRVGRMSAPEFVPLVTQMAQGAPGRAPGRHRPSRFQAEQRRPRSRQGAVGRGPRRRDRFRAGALELIGRQPVEALTGTGDIVGTPAYIAPEILDHRGATAATDIYAFGVVMYEMVTGRLPFEGDTPLIAVLERLRRPADSPRALVPDLDPRWEAIILRCLEREPADRFASAADAVIAFHEPATGHVPSLRRRRTNRVVMTVTAVALSAAAIFALATWAPRAPATSVAADPAATSLNPALGRRARVQEPFAATRCGVVVGGLLGHVDDGAGCRREAANGRWRTSRADETGSPTR